MNSQETKLAWTAVLYIKCNIRISQQWSCIRDSLIQNSTLKALRYDIGHFIQSRKKGIIFGLGINEIEIISCFFIYALVVKYCEII